MFVFLKIKIKPHLIYIKRKGKQKIYILLLKLVINIMDVKIWLLIVNEDMSIYRNFVTTTEI